MTNKQNLRELLAKATPGEWRQVDDMPYLHAFTPGQRETNHWNVPCVGRFDHGTGNLEFIAAAHNQMPALLDELDRLREALEESQSLFAAMCHEARPAKEITDQMQINRAALQGDGNA